jgi:DNA-binding transcriptional regulator YiaG
MEYSTSKAAAEATVEKIRDLRIRMNLTQIEFCERFGLSVSALHQWEMKRRLPDTIGVTYLRLILTDPEHVAALVSRSQWKLDLERSTAA